MKQASRVTYNPCFKKNLHCTGVPNTCMVFIPEPQLRNCGYQKMPPQPSGGDSKVSSEPSRATHIYLWPLSCSEKLTGFF